MAKTERVLFQVCGLVWPWHRGLAGRESWWVVPKRRWWVNVKLYGGQLQWERRVQHRKCNRIRIVWWGGAVLWGVVENT